MINISMSCFRAWFLCQVATWHVLPVLARKVASHPGDITRHSICLPKRYWWIMPFSIYIYMYIYMYCLFTIQNPSPETAMQVQIYCGASIYAFIRISASVSSVHHADAESVVRSSRRWSYWQMSYLGVSEIMEKTWKTNGNYHMKWNTCSCKIPFVNLLSLMDFPVTCLVYIIQSYGTCLNWFFSSNNSSTKKMTHVECFNSFSRIYEFNLDDKKNNKKPFRPSQYQSKNWLNFQNHQLVT